MRAIAHVARLIVYVALGVAAYLFLQPKSLWDVPFAQLTLGDIGSNLLFFAGGIMLIRLFFDGLDEGIRDGWAYVGYVMMLAVVAVYFQYFH